MEKESNRHRRNLRCLGPVKDLEGYVKPDWWANLFNAYYLKTDGDVVDDISITAREVDLFIKVLGINPENSLLDLCCGQGRHLFEFGRRGISHLEGLDRSHYLIQKAKTIAKREGLNIRFKEGDARKLPYQNDSFDFVTILGNSFGYFETAEDDLRVLKEVFRVLKPWGKILIDVTDGDYVRENYQPRSWEWIGKKYFVCRERTLSFDRQRLVTREVITHVEKGVVKDQFYAERLYSKESISNLLEKAGFKDINFVAELSPDSKRNQDLGMMERRIIVSAVAKKEWTPKKAKITKETKNVVVLLGDPEKPDPLKPLAVFDDDDFYTIDRLKESLSQLKNYNFIYLTNHDEFIQELQKLKGKIDYVFNLCDEGYYNDPLKELHIPAILETLGIPYTGSGPQTLAYCYDKSLVRGIAKEMEIPVPEAFFIKPEDATFHLPFEFPVIVKPNFGDSSFGITKNSVCHNIEQLINAISEIRERFGYDKPLLVEEFLTGKDLTVGIIGNIPDSYMVLPILEEDYSELPPDLPRICAYEAKWDPTSPYSKVKSVPANLPEYTKRVLIEYSIKLVERLNCRDYTRLDWRLDKFGNPKLLEVNPNPGWCWDGHLAKMCHFAKINYTGMLELILKEAEKRLHIS
uniref:Methyltransferase domain-containing protein n=1 Tax=candidate division WOR-3 bacterium TaxID=2052148 RepID=A0A7C4YDT9_UNCW3